MSCEKNPTFCQIKRNNPKVPDQFALKLSGLIVAASKKHKIPAQVYTAILMQESRYEVLSNSKCGYVLKNKKTEYIEEACIESDVGITQINYDTIKRYNFDAQRLHDDVGYAIDAGAQVLAWFRKTYASKEYDWWTRYNCGVKSSTDRDTCQAYKTLVSRYL